MSKTKSNPCFPQRSRIDIMVCILKSCNESSNRARLTHQCNLNFWQMRLFTDCLVAAGFLKISKRDDEIFETTEKGEDFLKDYSKIKDVLDREGKGETMA